MTGIEVLIVEDDEAIAAGLALNLKLEGCEAAIAGDGEAALARLGERRFDLLLLDISLPGISGLDVLAAMRARGDGTPVIVLSARRDEFDKVAALRLGADDYVTKPFALAELLARIEAVLRRATHTNGPPIATAHGSVFEFGDVAIDLGQRTVTKGGVELRLTHLEFELLVFFVRHPNQVFSRSQLFSLVWGQSAGSVRTVDNFVGQLRKRFEENPEQPRHFITVRGSGYRFDP